MDNNFIQSSSSSSSADSSPNASFDSFILDPKARDYVRDSLDGLECTENAWLACNFCVGSLRKNEIESTSLPEVHEYGRIMVPHAKTCYDDWSNLLEKAAIVEGVNVDNSVEWQVLGNVCMTQGAIEQAIGCFQLSLQKNGNGTMDFKERIQTSLSLASLLQQEGQADKCLDVLDEIDIESIDKALGFKVAMAKAAAAAANGNFSDAEDQFNRLELNQEETFGPTDIMTVSTVHNLATTLKKLGKFSEAQALYRRVFFSYKSLFGPSHAMTLEALEELAQASLAAGAIAESESLYKQSVDLKTRTLGAQHPSTADSLSSLAIIYDLKGDYDNARAKYQTALDILASSAGKAHPSYVRTLENHALNARYRAQTLPEGKDRERAFADAEANYRDVIGIKQSQPDLYSESQVLSTVSKLREMYENEPYYRRDRDQRLAAASSLLGGAPPSSITA
jgi:tetratricopeptide (TPR) repeat protein